MMRGCVIGACCECKLCGSCSGGCSAASERWGASQATWDGRSATGPGPINPARGGKGLLAHIARERSQILIWRFRYLAENKQNPRASSEPCHRRRRERRIRDEDMVDVLMVDISYHTRHLHKLIDVYVTCLVFGGSRREQLEAFNEIHDTHKYGQHAHITYLHTHTKIHACTYACMHT